MPRNQGTSRKGKPGKHDRMSGMGKALQKSSSSKHRGPSRPAVDHVDHHHHHNNTRSVLELNDLEDFLTQAEMAGREFASEREGLVVLDSTTTRAYSNSKSVQWADEKPPDFVFQELSVPRRPAWDETTTKQQLDENEKQAFLEWRRAIALQEERLAKQQGHHQSISVTPFEKNLQVWRQLWRVLERSSCLVQLVDARNPLFYLSHDLKQYAADLGKPMMVLINKSDYLSAKQRAAWREYLVKQGWESPIFFSATLEQHKLDAAAHEERQQKQEEHLSRSNLQEDNDSESSSERQGSQEEAVATDDSQAPKTENQDGVDALLTRQELMDVMLAYARQHNCQPHNDNHNNRIQFGMVGFPNVGKSSVINVLVGSSKHTHGLVRVAVASQPGKTKHFQTLVVTDEMMLCDCPGLVFPSFVSNTADLIAAGVYPIAQMRDHQYWPVISLICQRIPREIINAQYGIQLPVPTQQELRERGWTQEIPPPTAEELLATLCVARGLLAASSGVPDYPRAARRIVKDYADGKLLYCHPPPNVIDPDAFASETVATALNNTKKLRERLLKQQQQQQAEVKLHEAVGEEMENDTAADFIDDDLLELVGAAAPEDAKEARSASKHHGNKKGKTPKQKWGKKDRKNRNSDPYGCHSTPDEALFGAPGTSSGVFVNGGKYTRGSYTRPTSYPIGK